MRIQDLEEMQDLTPEMVKAYLERTGWTTARGNRWVQAQTEDEVWLVPDDLGVTLNGLVRVTGRTPQAILREIFPRMRQGWPTDADLAAHPGQWLMSFADVEMIIGWTPETIRERRERAPGAAVAAWPIDESGNKVLWPAPAGDGRG